MKRAQEFSEAIDALSGQVSFDLPLLTVPGPETLAVNLGLNYSSLVQETVNHWNLTHPTSVAGLGWSLPRSTIISQQNEGVSSGETSFIILHEGTTSALTFSSTLSDGSQNWIVVTEPNWLVTYSPGSKTWVIINQLGIQFTFGGDQGTEYSIAIGDWFASSEKNSVMHQVPTSWNLVSVMDLFGNQTRYRYDMLLVPISAGGTNYTQTSYLKNITGPWGDRVDFIYIDKQADEYKAAYSVDGYQSFYETKALDKVVYTPKDAQNPLITAQLTYDLSFISGDGQNKAFTKRLLESITWTYGTDQSLPALIFGYNTTLQSAINLGALNTITTMEGATVTYSYARAGGANGDIQYSQRDIPLTAPTVSGVTFGQPKFIFEDNFTVILWIGSDKSLVFQPYRWQGRWLAGSPITMPAGVTNGYDGIFTASFENYFAIMAQGKIFLYSPDPKSPEGWISNGAAGQDAPKPGGNTSFDLACGDGFVSYLCLPSGDLYRYDFTQLTWSGAQKIETGLTSQSGFSLSADQNKILLASVANTSISVWLTNRTSDGTWQSSHQTKTVQLGTSLSIKSSLGSACIAVLAGGKAGPNEFLSCYGSSLTEQVSLGDLTELTATTGQANTTDFKALGMTIQAGNLIWRFDGTIWIEADLSALGLAAGDTVNGVQIGPDTATRNVTLANSQHQYDLIAYEANTGNWAVKSTIAQPVNGTGVAVTAQGKNTPNRYAALADSLYYMSSDLDWAAVSGGMPPSLTAADAASVTILNSQYLLYQVSGSPQNETRAAFLGNGATIGSVVSTQGSLLVTGQSPDYLIGLQSFVSYTGDWAGNQLVLTLHRLVSGNVSGGQSAVTVSNVKISSGYTGTEVTLPDGEISDKVTLSGDMTTSIVFDVKGATLSRSGDRPAFNHMTYFSGSSTPTATSGGQSDVYLFNNLAPHETPVLAPPTGSNITNGNTIPNLLSGQIYTKIDSELKNNMTTPQSRVDNYWWATLTPLTAGWSAYVRSRRIVSTLDGVSKTENFTYSSDTGQLATYESSRIDGAGNTISTSTALTYFWQKYDSSRATNILDAVIEEIQSTTTTPPTGQVTTAKISGSVTTWQKGWNKDTWAADRSYRMTAVDAVDFNAWASDAPTPAGWQKTNTIEDYSDNGQVLKNTDIRGIESINLIDKEDRFTTASAFNANKSSFSFYGFEPYEDPNNWVSLSGGSLGRYITTTDAHTGSSSLFLPKATPAGTVGRLFVPDDLTQEYIFGCWTRTPPGFDKTNGEARFTGEVYWTESNVQKSAALPALTLWTTGTQWAYRQTTINLNAILSGKTPDANSVSVFFKLVNANTVDQILVDEVRLSPLQSSMLATVLDPLKHIPLAQIDTNGQSIRTIYNNFLQPIVTMGPEGEILTAEFSGLSRQLPGTNDLFVGDKPNTTISLTPGGLTQYDDFHGDTLADWTLTRESSGAWAIADDKLAYSDGTKGGLGATAQPKISSNKNFAVHVEATPDAGASMSIGDGSIFLSWNADNNSGKGGFSLISKDSQGSLTSLQNAPADLPFNKNWMFSVVDGFYLCTVNDLPLFTYDVGTTPPTGDLTLAVDIGGNFDELIRLDDPRMAISFKDALLRETQSLSLLGRPVTGETAGKTTLMNSGIFQDNLGRSVVSKQPMRAIISLAETAGSKKPELPDGGLDKYLDNTDGTPVSLPAFVETGISVPHMGTQFTYNMSRYEASPLGRPVKIVRERPTSNSDGMGYLSTLSYGGIDSLPNLATPQSTANAKYFQMQETIEIGSQTISDTPTPLAIIKGQVRDTDGNILETYAGPETAPRTLLQKSTYDAAGRLISQQQANAAHPPTGTAAANWTETFAYDFLSRRTRKTSPDSGEILTAFDHADRLRFIMDSEGATAKINDTITQRIKYIRYDLLGRVIETGWIQDAGFQWTSAALLAQIDNQAFPKVTGGSGTGPAANGRWRQSDQYDSDGQAETLNLLGRLYQSKSQADSGNDITTETKTYDANGRILTTSIILSGQSAATSQYKYTPAGNVASITYPALAGKTYSVGYYYDRIGRVAGVGQKTNAYDIVDPGKPIDWVESRYSAYNYGFLGELASADFNRPPSSTSPGYSRNIGYDEEGRLNSLEDPYLTIDLNYVSQDKDFTTQKIGSINTNYLFSEKWKTPPTAQTYAYEYDPLGRLINAQESENSAFGFTSPATGAAKGYDANGNRHSQSKGLTQYNYAYPTGANVGKPGTPANGYASITPVTNSSEDFSTISGNRAGPWSWQSNNGGPTSSKITTNDPHSGSQCLMLGGGNSLGHSENITLETYLSPQAVLTLDVYTRTGSDYSAAPGNQAVWSLVFNSPFGRIAQKTLDNVPAGASWTKQTLDINIPAILADLGLTSQISSVTLCLNNKTKGTSSGDAGASIYVDDISLSWPSAPTWNSEYNNNGNMIASPEEQITVRYDYNLNRAVSASRTGHGSIKNLYDSEGRLLQQTETLADNSTETHSFHYDLSGSLIAKTTTNSSDTSVSYYINGPDGLVATDQGADPIFSLKDHLGSTRALIDGATNDVVGSFDYLPFGGLSRASGDQSTLARYTNHRINPITGLIETPARLYEFESGRFLQVDPKNDGLSPYTYCWNDPINLTDASGEWPNFAQTIMTVVTAGSIALNVYNLWRAAEKYQEDPTEFLYVASATAIGIAVPYVSVRSVPFIGYGLSKLLVATRYVSHDLARIPTCIPVVTFVRQAGTYLIQQDVSSFAYLGLKKLFSGKSTLGIHHGALKQWEGAFSSYVGENLGWNIGLEAVYSTSGPGRIGNYLSIHHNPTHPNLLVFFPANLNPSFDEFASGFYWLYPWSLQGNRHMWGDVNQVAASHNELFNYNHLRAQLQTLQHDLYSDFATIVDRRAHTTLYGGPRHVGSSAFIRRGLATGLAVYNIATNWASLIVNFEETPKLKKLYNALLGGQED